MMQTFTYRTSQPIGFKAALGLIVLQSDETLEAEMRQMLPQDGVALYVSRVPSAPDVTRETLAQMGPELRGAAGLLPPSLRYASVGYGCTSGASVIGAKEVAKSVQAGCDAQDVTDPMTALVAACRALRVSRLAFLTPYIAQVSEGLRAAFDAQGITCTALGSFNEAEEAKVARIDEGSIKEAALALGRSSDVDAVFLSCTNLRTLSIINKLEAELNLPVLSSNQVLGWHLMHLAGIKAQVPGRLGQL
ncbi:MAG: Asp/Glu racemase [Aliishimia sp.]